ncbi:MAG TPA: hypothetical protein VLA34_13445 [Candidatus Krumholzibacterium sp.]|nr:hypothetical protein [Candidatus Krumholzibacterium sp.]
MHGRFTKMLSRPLSAAVALLLICASGCNEYRAEVKVLPDGSGTRAVRLSVSIDTDSGEKPDIETIRSLLSLDGPAGWKRVTESPSDRPAEPGDAPDRASDADSEVFLCEQSAGGPGDWARMSGDISIRGTLQEGKGNDVRLTNRISVDRSAGDGKTVLTYRETLEWKGLKAFVLDYVSDRHVRDVVSLFPGMSPVDRAELKGLAAGHFGIVFDQVDDDELYDSLLPDLASSLLETSIEIIGRSGPVSGEEALKESIDNLVYDRDNSFDRFLETSLPGADMAFSSELVLTLSMPGKIVETNGEISEDQHSVSWKVGLLDPFTGPVEMYAVSESSGK